MSHIKFFPTHASIQGLLWHITESVETLYSKLRLGPAQKAEWRKLTHPRRQREWLATRVAFQELCGHLQQPTLTLCKDVSGRPYLADSNLQVSISHSFPYAWVAVSPCSLGLDIERQWPMFFHTYGKFLSDRESHQFGQDLVGLTTCWCAKEAIYKAYAKQHLLKSWLDIKLYGDRKQAGNIPRWGLVGAQVFQLCHAMHRGYVAMYCYEVEERPAALQAVLA